MTAPTAPPDPAERQEPTRQDSAVLEVAIAAALVLSLGPWLAAATAAVLAAGAIAVTAIPLPTLLVARTLTRIRPDVIRTWARIMGRFGVTGADSSGPEQVLIQIGRWVDSADEHTYKQLTALISKGQQEGWTDAQLRTQIRAALKPDAANWQTWTARTAGLASGYTVEAAKSAAVAATGEVWNKTWISELDDRVRKTHLDAHGQTVPANGFFVVGGWPMREPKDPSAPAEETINCRCEADYRRG